MTTFREAYCQHYGCPAEQFELDLLLRCMTPMHRTVAQWVMRWRPEFYRFELRRLTQAGNVTQVKHLYDIASDFADPRRDVDYIRYMFGIRPSGRLLVGIAAELLEGGATVMFESSPRNDAPAKH